VWCEPEALDQVVSFFNESRIKPVAIPIAASPCDRVLESCNRHSTCRCTPRPIQGDSRDRSHGRLGAPGYPHRREWIRATRSHRSPCCRTNFSRSYPPGRATTASRSRSPSTHSATRRPSAAAAISPHASGNFPDAAGVVAALVTVVVGADPPSALSPHATASTIAARTTKHRPNAHLRHTPAPLSQKDLPLPLLGPCLSPGTAGTSRSVGPG